MALKEKYERFSISEVTNAPTLDGLYRLYRNRYWAVTENDEVLRYRGFSAQCNSDRQLTEKLVGLADYPGKKVQYIEAVFLPHRCDRE